MLYRKALAPVCLLSLSAAASAQLSSQLYASGFTNPLAMTYDPLNPGVNYVVEQGGRVRMVQGGTVMGDFLNLSGVISTGGERGLLGLTFDPNHATNGFLYVNYTDINGRTQISRFTRSTTNPYTIDVNTRHDIIRINQPFSNHNGGTMRFGPDGHLYIGMGDGGSGNDPQNNAQNPNSLLGKMLRIDVHGDDFPNDPLKNYAIPIDNPFLDGIPISASPEIWAFGLRNPWKFSFDPVTGAMLIADVGQSAREEVNYEPMGAGGRNYGWRMREGFISTGLGGQAYGPLTDPIWDYPRAQGRSITGGYVYRGNALPSFYQGRYFVGDFMDGKMWSLELILDANGEASVGTVLNHNAELGAMGMISSIDVDFMGELYVLDYSGGRILKIVPEPASMLALALGAALVVRRRRSRRA